jgi:hypothetical protein
VTASCVAAAFFIPPATKRSVSRSVQARMIVENPLRVRRRMQNFRIELGTAHLSDS